MITISEFASRLQTELNKNGQGIEFAIFSDAAQYKDALKTRTGKTLYTNGLLRVGSSSIVPTQGLVVATQSAVLELCVQLPNAETDAEIITAHRVALDKYAQKPVVDMMTETDEDGTEHNYTVTTLMSLANTGTTEFRDNIGTSVTFYVNIEYAYIENGLNSSNCKFTLDGFPIPYTSAKITKTPQMLGDAYSNASGVGKALNISFTRSFDFELPATIGNKELGAIISKELLGNGLNTSHTLVVWLGAIKETYSVIFGNTNVSLVGIDNAGHQISLVERAF